MAAYIKTKDQSEDDFIHIGQSVDTNTLKISGDAKFFIDLKVVPPSAAIDIEAAIVIPSLLSYGYVDIEVNSTAASFEGEL